MGKLYYLYQDGSLETKELEVLETTSFGFVYVNENGMQRIISYEELNKGRYFDSLKILQKTILKELITKMNTARNNLIQSENRLAEFLHSIRVADTPFEDILDLIQHDTDINKLLEEIFNDPINTNKL